MRLVDREICIGNTVKGDVNVNSFLLANSTEAGKFSTLLTRYDNCCSQYTNRLPKGIFLTFPTHRFCLLDEGWLNTKRLGPPLCSLSHYPAGAHHSCYGATAETDNLPGNTSLLPLDKHVGWN